MSDIYAAGAALSHIRALVCKALRTGAPAEEIAALLLAEERAAAELASVVLTEESGIW